MGLLESRQQPQSLMPRMSRNQNKRRPKGSKMSDETTDKTPPAATLTLPVAGIIPINETDATLILVADGTVRWAPQNETDKQ